MLDNQQQWPTQTAAAAADIMLAEHEQDSPDRHEYEARTIGIANSCHHQNSTEHTQQQDDKSRHNQVDHTMDIDIAIKLEQEEGDKVLLKQKVGRRRAMLVTRA